jgi:hypothetical protein
MACKCTQTTINATAGGAITSPFSACTYPLWINHVSGCTGSALDVHFGNPGANFLFNVGQYDYSEVGYATNNIGINVPNPIHTVSIGGTIDVENYLHMGDGVASGDTPYSVYLGYKAGETSKNNKNSSYNTVVGNDSLGSGGVLNAANHNVAVGYQSLRSLTSGDYNTVIGNGGGYNLTSQSGNVYLGYGQGSLETTEQNTLRIGNRAQTPGRTTRPLLQGDFETSGATIWGSARITTLPPGDEGFVTIDKDGYLHASKYTSGPSINKPISLMNTGPWTANTTDAAGLPWNTVGALPGYRSVSISGGTNAGATSSDWKGTRVGIGTGKPEVPFHVKAPYGWAYVQSTETSSYIASITSKEIAYLGMAAEGGVKSGSTTWRIKSFTTPLYLFGSPIGTGFSLMRSSRYTAGDASTQSITHPFSVLGDTENLDGAMVIRGDNNLGGIGGNKGVGIFTAKPTKELTVVGSISGTGAIHSTDYMKWPNPAESMYLGYGRPSGSTTSSKNTMIGWVDTTTAGAMNGAEGNTAVGWKTINNITSGELNVAIGREAGDSLTTGSLNTFVGAYAGTSITTQNANVYIGYAQGWNLTESSILRIGNNHNFNGEEPLIYGNMNTSGLTINGTVEIEGTLTGFGDGNTGGNEYVGVVGGVRATGTIQAPNLKFTDSNEFTSIGNNQFGVGSGTTNSNGNTFVGYGINTENALNVSNFNTSVGSRSMQYIGAAASSNTAVGYKSLGKTETGDENTAIGSTSLRDNETGSFNIGIGSFALGGSDTASNNLAVGNYAMANASLDGEFNIAIGDFAQVAITTANNNVTVGRFSQTSMTTGTFNTSIGDAASLSNRTGVHNVALGHKSSYGVTSQSHSYNTSIGSGSLSGITTGGCNVAVGNNAGSGIGLGQAITTGSNNITIGCQTNIKDGTGSNQINIGNSIFGRAINGSSTTNAIGILSDIPNHTLSVAGSFSASSEVNFGGFITGRDVGKGGSGINSVGIGVGIEGTIGTQLNTVLTTKGAISASTVDGMNGARVFFGNNENYISGGTTPSGNPTDLEIWSGNDIELKAGDDINLEATGKVEFTQYGAANSSMSIDLNDVPTSAFVENYSNNEVFGINASTRRLYLLWQGGIPANQQTWISGNESNGGEIDLTIGSSNDVIFSATSIGMGTTLPKTKLDVHHDPTGLSNDTGGGEVITFGSAGTGYAAGNLVQLRGASNWVRADADDTTLQGNLVGMALGAAPSDGILIKGFYKINTADDVGTWANGGQLYASTVVGKITESTGSMSSGDYVRVVGYMTTTTNVIYFNPESTFIVIT